MFLFDVFLRFTFSPAKIVIIRFGKVTHIWAPSKQLVSTDATDWKNINSSNGYSVLEYNDEGEGFINRVQL